jgi:hypothetical protein
MQDALVTISRHLPASICVTMGYKVTAAVDTAVDRCARFPDLEN